MAYIVETIVADRRIQLGNEAYVRKMAIGPYWTKIRLGVRLAVNGRSDISNAVLDLGFCVDPGSHSGADRSNGCFGCFTSNQASVGYNSVQANSSYYNFGQNSVYAFNKLNNVRTEVAMSLGNQLIILPANPAGPGMFACTWTRTGTVISVTDTFFHIGSQVPGSVTASQFYQYMENDAGSGMTGVTRITNGQTAMTTGLSFPYAFVKWSHSTPTIEITHIAVTRFY